MPYITTKPLGSSRSSLVSFPVFSTVLEQHNGNINPKINQRLQQTHIEKLQSKPKNMSVANQNTLHIPQGNIIIAPIR